MFSIAWEFECGALLTHNACPASVAKVGSVFKEAVAASMIASIKTRQNDAPHKPNPANAQLRQREKELSLALQQYVLCVCVCLCARDRDWGCYWVQISRRASSVATRCQNLCS